ncbi:MAG: HAD hydrolase-like protein [Puniceicoccaceae bacterium]
MAASPCLFLWDIDGTLISVGGAGERALVHAIRDTFGFEGDLSGIDYAGRTDRTISRMLHEFYGVQHTTESQDRFMQAYLDHLEIEMQHTRMHLLPQVPEILNAIDQHPHCYQGLLTGNLRRGGKIKLDHYGIWHHFPFGGFSDASHLRNELAEAALVEAQRHTGISFEPQRVVVIGDTPHDITCGQHIGARTYAVCTGRFRPEDLAPLQPDFLKSELPGPSQFLSEVFAVLDNS